MKLFIVCAIVLLLAGSSYSQNAPNIPGPEGLNVSSFSTGLFYKRIDLVIPCQGVNIDMTFYYNTGTTAIDLGYGGGWSMTYSMLYQYESATTIALRYGTGRKEKFNFNGSKWVARAGVFDSLFQYEPGKFQLREKNGNTYFFENSVHKKLTKIIDRNNNALIISYTDGLPTTITDPTGRYINLNYNSGHLVNITDPNTSPTRQINYDYDSHFNPISVTDPVGSVIQYEYDRLKRMIRLIDQTSNPYIIVYGGSSGFSVSQIKSPLSILNYYISSLFTFTVSEMVNNVVTTTSYKFQDLYTNNVIQKTGSCCGFNESYEYDPQNNMRQKTDANLNVWFYEHDSKGNITKETDPLGGETIYVYEPVYNQMIVKKIKEEI